LIAINNEMGTKEKLVDRFKSLPNNFTFEELIRLFRLFGFEIGSKEKTADSRVTRSGHQFTKSAMCDFLTSLSLSMND